MFIERQRLLPQSNCCRERGIEVREQISAARCLPNKSGTEFLIGNGDEQKITNAFEMFGCCAPNLMGRREMYEAVARIIRGAAVDTRTACCTPRIFLDNLIDHCVNPISRMAT
jgi:hypothetical protein